MNFLAFPDGNCIRRKVCVRIIGKPARYTRAARSSDSVNAVASREGASSSPKRSQSSREKLSRGGEDSARFEKRFLSRLRILPLLEYHRVNEPSHSKNAGEAFFSYKHLSM